MSSVTSLSLNPMDIFQISSSSSFPFFIWKTIDCSFPFWNNSSVLCCPVHSLLWITLFFPCSASAISSLPTVSQGLFIFILLLYILRQSHLHQSFYYYLFLDDSQLSISIPDFSDHWIRIYAHLLSSIGIPPRHLKFVMSKLFSCTSSLFLKPGPLLPLPVSVSHCHPWNVLLLPTNPYHSWWWLINRPGLLLWLLNTLPVCFSLHLDGLSSGYFALLLEHLEAFHSSVQI